MSAPLGLRNARSAAVNSKQTTTTLQKDAPTNPFATKKTSVVKPAKLVSPFFVKLFQSDKRKLIECSYPSQTMTKPSEPAVNSPMDKSRPATRSNTSKRTIR